MFNPVDFNDDVNQQHLYAINRLFGLPNFVKSASVEEKAAIDKLHSNVFADVSRRKFPCHTKAATWLANAYFAQCRDAYHKKEAAFIQDRITKFAAYWKIASLVDTFNQNHRKTAQFDVDSLPDEKFAMVMTTGDGNKVRRLPMPNPLAVKMAGERLYADRSKYPYEWRKAAARRILKEAIYYNEKAKRGEKIAGAALGTTHFDTDTLEYLERASGFGTTHPLQAAEKVARRVIMLKGQPGFKDHATKLANIALSLSKLEAATPAMYQKLAAVIDYTDREAGLHRYYHQGVDMPEELFFDVLEKEAQSILESHVRLTTGQVYPLGVIANLPLEKISEVLGKEFSDAVSAEDGLFVDAEKFAEIAPTLPRDDAALLDRAIEAAINEPLEKGARAALMSRCSFDKDDLVEQFKAEGRNVATTDFQLTVTK